MVWNNTGNTCKLKNVSIRLHCNGQWLKRQAFILRWSHFIAAHIHVSVRTLIMSKMSNSSPQSSKYRSDRKLIWQWLRHEPFAIYERTSSMVRSPRHLMRTSRLGREFWNVSVLRIRRVTRIIQTFDLLWRHRTYVENFPPLQGMRWPIVAKECCRSIMSVKSICTSTVISGTSMTCYSKFKRANRNLDELPECLHSCTPIRTQ